MPELLHNSTLTSLKSSPLVERFLVPGIGGLILFLAIFITLVPGISLGIPNFSDSLSYKTEIEATTQKATTLHSKIGTLQGLDQAKLTADLSKVAEAIPDDKDLAGTLGVINQVAGASNTTVATAQLVTTGSNKPIDQNTVEFQIIMKGSFPAIKDFLVKLENAKRLIAVKSVNINLGDANSLTADMVLDSYYDPLVSVASLNNSELPTRNPSLDKTFDSLASRTNYPAPTPTSSAGGRADPFTGF